MQMTSLLAGITLMSIAGCAPAADLRDQFQMSDRALRFDQKLRAEVEAPVIVLGLVLHVTDVGQPHPSSGDPRIGVQLSQIRAKVEAVIKGDVGSDSVEFYYFMNSPMASKIDLGAPRYLPAVGQRRIFFLKPLESSYRSVGDVLDYTLLVSSGTHDRAFCQGLYPGCCIAQVLLVPQKDLEVGQFAADLVVGEYAAEVLCSRHKAQELLQKLTEYPDAVISDRAREVIAGTRLPAR